MSAIVSEAHLQLMDGWTPGAVNVDVSILIEQFKTTFITLTPEANNHLS